MFPFDLPFGITMARIVEFHVHPMGEDAATPTPQAFRRPTPRVAALDAQQRAAEHAPPEPLRRPLRASR